LQLDYAKVIQNKVVFPGVGGGSAAEALSQHGFTYDFGSTKSENDETDEAKAPKSPTVNESINKTISTFDNTLKIINKNDFQY